MKKRLFFGFLLILICYGVCTHAEDLSIELTSAKSNDSYMISIDFPEKTDIAVLSFEISYDSSQFSFSDFKDNLPDGALLQVNDAYDNNKAKISFMSLEPVTDKLRFTFLLTPKSDKCETEIKLENIQMADINENRLSATSNGIIIKHNVESKAEGNVNNEPRHYSGGGGGSIRNNNIAQTEIKDEAHETATEPIKNDQKAFSDLDGFDWARQQISFLAEKNIIKGTGEDSFSPEQKIKRGDFICLLVRMMGLEPKSKDNFKDVYENEYWYNEIGAAKENGIAYGNEGEFSPGDNITREDMFVLTARAMKYTGGSRAAYTDYESISEYARDGINTMTAKGLIQGNNGFIDPKNNATRAETAVMLYNIYNYQGGSIDE